jgi:hypothetical protein
MIKEFAYLHKVLGSRELKMIPSIDNMSVRGFSGHSNKWESGVVEGFIPDSVIVDPVLIL